MRFRTCLIFLCLLLFFCEMGKAQDKIMVITEDNSSSPKGYYIYEIDLDNSCSTEEIVKLDVVGSGLSSTERITDIAIAVDGTIYVTTTETHEIYSVDLNSGDLTFFTDIPLVNSNILNSGYLNALTASADGYLYAATKRGEFFKINLSNASVTALGSISQGSNGDLTFNSGNLYLASDDNKLIEVNINNPSSSKVIGTFSGTTIYDLVSFFSNCDENATYGISNKSIYKLNINTAQTNFYCTPSFNGESRTIFGSSSYDEFNGSACTLYCDLNTNQSGNNNTESFDCASQEIAIAEQSTLGLTSSSPLTKIEVSLSSGILDTGDESLSYLGAVSNISANPTSGSSIVLSNNGNASVEDFEKALSAIKYQNKNLSPSTGDRIIAIEIANEDGLSDIGCSIKIEINCAADEINIDLDQLDSKNLGNDFSGIYPCNTPQGFLIAPQSVFKPEIIDTFFVEIVSGLVNIGAEYLTIQNFGLKKVTNSSQTKITMINEGGLTSSNFIDALGSCRYVNDANPKTRGIRTIHVSGKTGNYETKTIAIATVEIKGPDAGKYDSLKLCSTGNPVSLFDANSPSAPPDNKNGTWALGIGGPTLASGTDIFEPGVDAAGTYVYSMLDNCLVEDTAQVEVIVNDPMSFDALPNDTFFCEGSHISLNGFLQDAKNYEWSTDINGNTIIQNGASYTTSTPRTYYLFAEMNGCKVSDQIIITEEPMGSLDVQIVSPPETDIYKLCNDQDITLTANTFNTTSNSSIVYKWSNGSNDNTITVNDSSNYIITAMQGCAIGKDSILIQLEDCSCPIFVPNAFNPLSLTQVNNSFYPITDGCETFIEGTLTIYDRWGKKVFEGDEKNPWNGADFPLDTYVWQFVYSYRDIIDPSKEIEEKLKGFVILVK